MTQNQILWSRSRDNLVRAVTALGFSAELADLLARELGSPKAIDAISFVGIKRLLLNLS